MSNPTKVKIKDKIYNLNTDFRIAIKCDSIARDSKISDFERALAIIYLLYGEEGLNSDCDYEQLIKLGLKYIALGHDKESVNQSENKEADMDLVEDEGYIKSSFKFDYGYDPYQLQYLHWYDFYNDLANLSSNEFGSCCILSRVRMIRNYDLSQIKDPKAKREMQELKERLSLKKKEKVLTDAQIKSIERFNQLAGLS